MMGLDAILNIGTKLIDKLIPDPEAKAKAQFELTKMAQDGELAKLQYLILKHAVRMLNCSGNGVCWSCRFTLEVERWKKLQIGLKNDTTFYACGINAYRPPRTGEHSK